MKKQTVVAPLGVATADPKKYKISAGRKRYNKETGQREYVPAVRGEYILTMYLEKQPNKTKPLEYMHCTHIRKGKDYPYNSDKRGWTNIELKETA
jgi:hypothetical protein